LIPKGKLLNLYKKKGTDMHSS
jgi:hypothetical protein